MAFDFLRIYASSTSDTGQQYLVIATSGMVMWMLLIPRLVLWRWSACSSHRLLQFGSAAIGMTTAWSVIVVGIIGGKVIRYGWEQGDIFDVCWS